jgi:hypothetical protein
MSAMLPVILFAAIVLLANPWGNFPLNDDWIYAHVARTFALTGRLRFDPGFAPSLVGQVLLAAPFIKSFGFSHTLLRILSMFAGALTLLGMARILRLLNSPAPLSFLVLACLAVNPLFLYLSTTYLSEIYGSCALIWASALWLGKRAHDIEADRPLRYGSTLTCGVMFGAAFWFRQFFALGFPAWMAAYILCGIYTQRTIAIRQSLKPIALAAFAYAAIVAGFFAWAKASGNYAGEFSLPLRNIFLISIRALMLQLAMVVPYLTFFSLPLLLAALPSLKKVGKTQARIGIVIFLSFAAWQNWALHHLEGWVNPQLFLQAYYNHYFPYFGNVAQNFGVGPVTLTDSYFAREQVPVRIPEVTWKLIFLFVYLFQFCWFLILGRIFGKGRERPAKKSNLLALELGLFGMVFSLLTWGITVQAYKYEVYDRYIFPVFLGTLLALAAFATVSYREKLPKPILAAIFALLFLEATYSLAGLHDQFQWQGARWTIFHRAQAQPYGVAPAEIDGGYEVNGWTAYEPTEKPLVPCAKPEYWSYCHSARYSIDFLGHHCRNVVLTEPVQLFLVEVSELRLCRNF